MPVQSPRCSTWTEPPWPPASSRRSISSWGSPRAPRAPRGGRRPPGGGGRIVSAAGRLCPVSSGRGPTPARTPRTGRRRPSATRGRSTPRAFFSNRPAASWPREYLEAGDTDDAEEAATKYLAAFSNGAGRAEVRLTLGEIFLRSGRPDQAEEALRRIWIELPGTPQSQRAQDLLASLPAPRPSRPTSSFSEPPPCTSSAGMPRPFRNSRPSPSRALRERRRRA